jgi:hypothetical protein
MAPTRIARWMPEKAVSRSSVATTAEKIEGFYRGK